MHEEDEVQEVRCIKEYRESDDRYLVSWKGVDETHDSWEPARNLKNCQQRLAEFKQREEAKRMASAPVRPAPAKKINFAGSGLLLDNWKQESEKRGVSVSLKPEKEKMATSEDPKKKKSGAEPRIVHEPPKIAERPPTPSSKSEPGRRPKGPEPVTITHRDDLSRFSIDLDLTGTCIFDLPAPGEKLNLKEYERRNAAVEAEFSRPFPIRSIYGHEKRNGVSFVRCLLDGKEEPVSLPFSMVQIVEAEELCKIMADYRHHG
jgi:hypothetical protein